MTDLDTKCQELRQQSTPNTASNRAGQGGQDTKQKIKRLQEKILALREENVKLGEKQETTNSSIGSYISEMSTMLSSAELESALVMGNPDTESDEDYE